MTKKSVPRKIIVLKSNDKLGREKWSKNRDLMNFPAGYRMVLCGPPSCGKSCIVKNLLVHAEPLYDRAILCHFDNLSRDYEDTDVETFDNDFPRNDDIDGSQKNLIIFEDLNYDGLSKEQKNDLASLFKYVSSHKNCSIIWTCHDLTTGLAPCIRRLANIYVLFKLSDMSTLNHIGQKCGMTSKDFMEIFKEYIKQPHDNLCIDLTQASPAPLRLNMYQKLKLNNDIDDVEDEE